jgi:SAM-dependent methyltransferase
MEGLDRQPRHGDAFGAALLDVVDGGVGRFVLERDDGLVDAMDASIYFAEPEEWPEPADLTLGLVSGRALDVGAGPGRHTLALQARGHEVVALDVSATAIEVCRSLGAKETFLGSLTELVDSSPAPFDTILLLGHNLGLLESEPNAARLFGLMRRLLSPGGTVIGSGMNPYLTEDPVHIAYHERNRERGRLPGQARLRVRYRELAGDWFEYLYASPDELSNLAAHSGWETEIAATFDPSYLAVLRPT